MFSAIRQYFIEAYGEMKKVTWPTREQAITYSALVIVLSVGVAVFFSIIDYVFDLGIQKFFLK